MASVLTLAEHRRSRGLIDMADCAVEDLGPTVCALVYWRNQLVRVIVSDRVRDDLVATVAIHAETHLHDQLGSESWGETTAWCDTATCWAAQTWLPACLDDVVLLAAPA